MPPASHKKIDMQKKKLRRKKNEQKSDAFLSCIALSNRTRDAFPIIWPKDFMIRYETLIETNAKNTFFL